MANRRFNLFRPFGGFARLGLIGLLAQAVFAQEADPASLKEALSPVEQARLLVNRAAFPDHVTGVKLDLSAAEASRRWSESRTPDAAIGSPPPIVVTAGPFPGTPYRSDPNDDRDIIEFAVAEADLVVIGTVADEATFLTRNREFLFGQFRVSVEEVLKGRLATDTIRVIRPGGTATLSGVTIRAIDNFFKPFRVGERYLMILRHIRESDTFLADYQGTFLMDGDRVGSMCRGPELDWLIEGRTVEDLREHVIQAVFGERQGKPSLPWGRRTP